jgi:hypothetical protein
MQQPPYETRYWRLTLADTVLDMCPGEKRTLTVQSEYAYGERGIGPIPANSVLSKCRCMNLTC